MLKSSPIVRRYSVQSAGDRPAEERNPFRHLFVGTDFETGVFGGKRRVYVNLDNAATTPAFKAVAEAVSAMLECYGPVHRGTGAKSCISTRCYDKSREVIEGFVGADPQYHAVLFTRNTTDSINLLARTIARRGKLPVLYSQMEHHSNMLPWRAMCDAESFELRDADGGIDLQRLEDSLKRKPFRLVAVTGASNVTGFAPPVHEIARLAHKHGAEILVDAAQLAGHQPVKMGKAGEPDSIDYMAFSAHKMYAPFGAGVLVGPRYLFEEDAPAQPGGGTVRLVTDERIIWADSPARDEAGTPNVIGAVATAKAAQLLGSIGLELISMNEAALRKHMVERLKTLPEIRIFSERPPADHGQVGIISFLSDRMNHSLMAAALGHEWGIGLRHGCFCAHGYMMRLLGIGESEKARLIQKAEANDHSGWPGLVRISLGIYNSLEETDYVADAVADLLENGPRERYTLNSATGEYLPVNPPAVDARSPL